MDYTLACLIAITRFMARCGRLHTIISDNGAYFVGAPREFKEFFNEWDQDALCERLAREQIIWKFNSPGSPHFDGI